MATVYLGEEYLEEFSYDSYKEPHAKKKPISKSGRGYSQTSPLEPHPGSNLIS